MLGVELVINVDRLTELAGSLVNLLMEKNEAYGDSFFQSGKVIKILYPNGVTTDQYDDLLVIVRLLDKLFRVATRKDAFGESPWNDSAGYCLLAVLRDDIVNTELANSIIDDIANQSQVPPWCRAHSCGYWSNPPVARRLCADCRHNSTTGDSE
uniref:Uncharacterized protein n=1 Tax=viral metagenome TaxID=1070528 RepID=A0A6M3LKC2_9ZZZZ